MSTNALLKTIFALFLFTHREADYIEFMWLLNILNSEQNAVLTASWEFLALQVPSSLELSVSLYQLLHLEDQQAGDHRALEREAP
jgi:hypothetical protein